MVGEYPLDKKDKELLSLLYIDSRMSFTNLGKRLKLSSSSVERRMQRLMKNGVINLTFADVNLSKLGYESYRVYLKFDVMDDETENGVLRLFEEYPRTLWGVICEGAYDVLWRVVAKDAIEVENAIGIMTERFGKKIIEKTVITSTYQTYLSWNRAFGGERHPELPMESVGSIESRDETDIKILEMLYKNSRETTVNIAQKVGLTPDAVSYRMKRLREDGFILGYTTWYDAKRIGFDYFKILISFRSITKEKEKAFLNFCLRHDNVIFLNKTIGSWDIEVDVIVENTVELHRFLTEIKTKFGHIIGSHKYIAIIEERMLNPLRGELRQTR